MNAGVAICADLAEFGLDPDAVSAGLEADGAPAIVLSGPCGGEFDTPDWDRTVLAVCPPGPSGDEVQHRSKRFAAEAQGARVDVVRVAAFGPPGDREERARMVLAARLAGLRAAESPSPAGFRMAVPAGRLTRRSLLFSGGIRHVPVATVGEVGCRGSVACGLCVEACPVGAIRRNGRAPQVERQACIGCGACVSACPVEGAAQLPGADLRRFEAELGALIGRGHGAGLLLTCASSQVPPMVRLTGTWLPVEVPCLSVVTPAWALTALASGAPAIAFRGCGATCRASAEERMTSVTAFVRESLSLAGVDDPEARVRLLLPQDDGRPAGPAPEGLGPLGSRARPPMLREPKASATALSALGATTGSIRSDAAPLGLVGFDPADCTMCGLCAMVCPTGAIQFDPGGISATLALDRSACVGCGHCAAICPEGVLSTECGVAFEALDPVTEPLKRSALTRCRHCGEPVAAVAMLGRLRPKLEPEVLASTEGLCQRCRGPGRQGITEYRAGQCSARVLEGGDDGRGIRRADLASREQEGAWSSTSPPPPRRAGAP